MIQTKTVYVPVGITERQPEKEGWYFSFIGDETKEGMRRFWDGSKWYPAGISHWLERQEEMYVMDKSEMHEMKCRLFAEFENDFNQNNHD